MNKLSVWMFFFVFSGLSFISQAEDLIKKILKEYCQHLIATSALLEADRQACI